MPPSTSTRPSPSRIEKAPSGSSHSSTVSRLLEKSREERIAVLLKGTAQQRTELRYNWRAWARPEQLAPGTLRSSNERGDWDKWLFLGGRGSGKTRSGAEFVHENVESGSRNIALIGSTASDVRDVMVFGPAGILATGRPWNKPTPVLSRRRIEWANGAVAMLFSADEPDRLRGPQHDLAWCDECAAWRYGREAYEMLMLGLRMGTRPRCFFSTTPKPVEILIGTGENGRMLGLLNDPRCAVTHGSSYENRANLADQFFAYIVKQYEGTRLGRQELLAEIIEDLGGLWSRAMIENARVRQAGDLSRIVVAVDPAVTSGEESDETGIVVAGRSLAGDGYILADKSGRYAPLEWARRAIECYKQYAADRIVAEVNNGGDMVEATLRMVDPNVPFTAVRASRGKVVRAEPVAALYEQGRVHHVGAFSVLEDQMASFTSDFSREAAGYSPDRVDALVWAISELLVEQVPYEGLIMHYQREAEKVKAVAPSRS